MTNIYSTVVLIVLQVSSIPPKGRTHIYQRKSKLIQYVFPYYQSHECCMCSGLGGREEHRGSGGRSPGPSLSSSLLMVRKQSMHPASETPVKFLPLQLAA
jgi:hypothetical protein